MKTPQKENGNGEAGALLSKMVKIKRTTRFKLDHLVVKRLAESRELHENDYHQLAKEANEYANAMQARLEEASIQTEQEPDVIPVKEQSSFVSPAVENAADPGPSKMDGSETERMEVEPESEMERPVPFSSSNANLSSQGQLDIGAANTNKSFPISVVIDIVADDEDEKESESAFVLEIVPKDSVSVENLPSAPISLNVEKQVATPMEHFEEDVANEKEAGNVGKEEGHASASSTQSSFDSLQANLPSRVHEHAADNLKPSSLSESDLVQGVNEAMNDGTLELDQKPVEVSPRTEYLPSSPPLSLEPVEEGDETELEHHEETKEVKFEQTEAFLASSTPATCPRNTILSPDITAVAAYKIIPDSAESHVTQSQEEGADVTGSGMGLETKTSNFTGKEPSAPVSSNEQEQKQQALQETLEEMEEDEAVDEADARTASTPVFPSTTIGDVLSDARSNIEGKVSSELSDIDSVSRDAQDVISNDLDVNQDSNEGHERLSSPPPVIENEDNEDKSSQLEIPVKMEEGNEDRNNSTGFSTPTSSRTVGVNLLSNVRLDLADRINPRCSESDIVVKEEGEDVTGSIFELEQDEISTPKGSRRGKLAPTPNFNISHWIKPEVLLEEMWQKKKTLRFADDNGNEFHFPSASFKQVMDADSWEIPRLMELKEQLNRTKSHLDYLPLQAWHHHTKRMNISNLVMSYVKRYFNPEFSSVAWGKFFEMLCQYEVIPSEIINRAASGEKVPLNSIHLCEAPGAFISALNHFLKTRHPNIDWNWLATTLNPYHEGNDISKMINDDRLILMSLNHWTFLEDSTGNILNSNNLKYLMKLKEEKLEKSSRERQHSRYEREGVFLVTADGSIDCQANPAEQERLVAHLQYGEIISALSLLRFGGSFILKIFTFLEAPTICHLYLLSCVFKELHLFKPSTSKEGNSEVYVICLGFLGKSSIRHVWQSKLVGKLETYEKVLANGKVLLPLPKIPKFFINRLLDAAEYFCGYQMKIIMRNWNTFGCDTRIYNLMKPFRMEAAEEWLENCELKPLPAKLRLISDVDDGKVIKPHHLDFKMEEGCFADKAIRAKVEAAEKLGYLQYELSMFLPLKGSHNHVLFGSFLKVGPVVFEKPYSNIRCSRFCLGSMLSIRNEVRELVKPYKDDLVKQGLCEMSDFCKGHEKKRVHASMSKSCDVEFDNLEIMCFNKLTYDFVTKTDFEQQQEDLTKLFDAVFNRLGKDRSMFLCRYPMLSRLQVGLIFCLASVFEKVIIYGDASKQVVGIMLYKFLGLARPELKNMMQSISDIFEILTDADFNLPVLQLVPMKRLVDHMPCEFLVKYNIHVLKQDIQRSIGVIHSLMATSKAAQEETQLPETDLTA